MRAAALALAFAAPVVLAADGSSVVAFSQAPPGATAPAPWRELILHYVRRPQFALVDDAGTTVLRVTSQRAAGTLAHPLHLDAARKPMLAWRWKVDRVIEHANLATRSGDDFAARVYVFFDVPSMELPVGARIKLAVARLIYGNEVPAAALCYVWDNTHPVGTSVWSPYTDRVRVVVLESGSARAGQWVEEKRDVASDYRAAFGTRARLPPVSGIAAGNDTDQTGETVSAWFGDFRFGPAEGAR